MSTVYMRDANFLSSPGFAMRFHLARPQAGVFGFLVAKCNQRIMLNDENSIPQGAAGSLMCKRCARMKEGRGDE